MTKRKKSKSKKKPKKQGLDIYLPTRITTKKGAEYIIRGLKKRLADLGVKVTDVKKTEKLVIHGKYGTARVWKVFTTKRKK